MTDILDRLRDATALGSAGAQLLRDVFAAIEQRDAEIARLREWQEVACELHNALVGEGRAGAIDWDRIELAFARIDRLDAALAALRRVGGGPA